MPTDEPLRRRTPIAFVADLGDQILERAKAQHESGVGPFSLARTGLAEVDRIINSWWGVSVLTSDRETDLMALATQIAYATAAADGRVLWLSMSGDIERPVFFLLTALSGVPARSVFVERTLGPAEWGALASARQKIESLPFMVAEAHGLSVSETRAVCTDAKSEMPLDLVIVEGAMRGDVRLLATLEDLSDDLGSPMLVLADEPRTPRSQRRGAWWSRLRQGSTVLHMGCRGRRGARSADLARGKLEIARVGSDSQHSCEVLLDRKCRRLINAAGDS